MNLTVKTIDGETYLHAEGALPVGTWPRLQLLSSDVRVPNLDLASPLWDPGVAWSVQDRVRNGGDEKGRAIALWHQAKGAEATPFAVLTWHTEGTGPFYVFSVGTRINLGVPLRKQLEGALLEVMVQASKKPDAPVAPQWQNTLRWATAHIAHAPHPDRPQFLRHAVAHARRLAFSPYQPPPPAPAKLSKTWLGERSF